MYKTKNYNQSAGWASFGANPASEESIIIPQNIRVLVKMPARKTEESKVGKLTGMLKEYKSKYSSVELQKKSSDWWKNVSD